MNINKSNICNCKLQDYILKPFKSGLLFNHSSKYDISLYFKEDRIRYKLISNTGEKHEVISKGNQVTTDILQEFKLSKEGKDLVNKYL